jgi:hypothetical protein
VIDALAGAVGVVQHLAPAPTFNGRAVVEQVLAGLESPEEPRCAGDRRPARAVTRLTP